MMKIILAVAFCLSAHFAFAQTENEVAAAVEKMRLAMIAEDVATLKAMTSESLSYGHSSGAIENRDQFLAVFESKTTDYLKWEIADQSIVIHGKDLAIVRHQVTGEISEQGKITTPKIGLMMVWVKEKGTWKLLARQAFRAPQAQ